MYEKVITGVPAVKLYLTAVKKQLPIVPFKKKSLLAAIQNALEDYLEEHPEANVSDLEQAFGSAEATAQGIISSSSLDILHQTKHQHRLAWFFLAVLILFSLLGTHTSVQIWKLSQEPIRIYRGTPENPVIP